MNHIQTIPLRLWPHQLYLDDRLIYRIVDCPDEQEWVVEIYEREAA